MGKDNRKWSLLEQPGNSTKGFLVVCPKCGEIGRLYYSVKIGWYIKHGKHRTHYVRDGEALEVPLHNPRLNIVRYMGGDSFLLPYLARMIPPHECYVEVFGGSAPLLLNKPPSKVEIYNDLDGDLFNLFKVVRERLDEFLKKTEWLLVSRQQYYDFLRRFHEIKDPVERAVAYWYMMKLTYAGKFGGGLGFGPKRNYAKDMRNALKKLKLVHRRLMNVMIEQLDFREILKRYDTKTTFFYLDPPHLYLSTESERGKDYYKQGGFTDKDYMDMLNLLDRLKGKWLLKQSVNIPWLLEWAKKRGYFIRTLRLKKFARPNPRAKSLSLIHI